MLKLSSFSGGLIVLVVLSFQCQGLFSMDAGDPFWNETMGKCQDWWVRINNDPLPNHAIFYIVNLSYHSCELEFNNVGKNSDKILLNSGANYFRAHH